MEKRLRDCNFSFENLHHNRIFADHLEILFRVGLEICLFAEETMKKRKGMKKAGK
jgi:hypothetical protein